MPVESPDTYSALKFLWVVLAAPIGWLFKVSSNIKGDVRDVEKDVAAHKLYAANNFVKHPDLKETETRIIAAITELKTQISNKADK